MKSNNLNYSELIDFVSKETLIPKNKSKLIIEKTFEKINEELKKEKQVRIKNFGVFQFGNKTNNFGKGNIIYFKKTKKFNKEVSNVKKV